MKDKLTKSILAMTGSYLLLQLGIFLAFSLGKGFFGRFALAFFILVVGSHLFLTAMLLLFRKDFVLESTGERLDHINLANKITFFRISTLPTLLVLIIAAKDYRIRVPLLGLVLLVFLSDFVDGYVSRKSGEVTRVGRMMDSASDYSLLVVLTVVFYYFALIPVWFFGLVIGRLFLQAVLMAVLFGLKKHIEPKTTLLGKVAVASIMVLYAIEVARMAFGGAALDKAWPFVASEWLAGSIIIASVVDKVVAFIIQLKETPPLGTPGRPA